MSEVVVNCSCGQTWTYDAARFYNAVYIGRIQGFACDFCGKVPVINYGGMEA